jgi:hypothetical protein
VWPARGWRPGRGCGRRWRSIEILGILTGELHLHGAFWSQMANFNINTAGFCIARTPDIEEKIMQGQGVI